MNTENKEEFNEIAEEVIRKSIKERISDFYRNCVSLFAKIGFSVFALSVLILVISKFSPSFADFFNRYISSSIRFVLSKITGILPFSLGETIFLSIPLIFISIVTLYFKYFSKDDIKATRFLVTLTTCLALMFSCHSVSFGIAYNCSPLAQRLGLEQKTVTPEELEYTAVAVRRELEKCTEDIYYKENGASVMPYSYKELNAKLNQAYKKACKKYEFIPDLKSNVKLLAVSPIMTYTHISGIYTYYTGEANINFNYPDYTAPYTMAHEMAHQRGAAPEDEANFVAFLVCMESNDIYIRYSAYLSMYEYLLSAYYEADAEGYNAHISKTDLTVRREMIAFSEFFSKYQNSGASKVSNAINDTYLKASGEKAGAKSYGLVVDLACAYYAKESQ
ncbi:MAG: DUF3810 domain-containing protein [Clostridia bacterium]|nr:DUF3810 domain-containing protein [Clostridia bacterium]